MSLLSRATPQPVGRVLFVDGDLWEPFGQLAAALRQHGIVSDHITATPRHWRSRYSQGLEKMLFARTDNSVEREAQPGAPAWVSPEHVARWVTADTLDVQARDDLGHQLLSSPLMHCSPLRHARALARPEQIYDKWAMTTLARRIGVPTPPSWQVAAGPPPAGTTVLLKSRVGFGGQGLEVIRDSREWFMAVDRARRIGAEPFAQEFVGKRTLNVAGVAQGGQILVAASYETSPPANAPFAPATSIQLIRHDVAMKATGQLLEATGLTGMFCVDFVLKRSGEALFIDLNPRVFGSWAALQGLGFDLIGAYLRTLGIGPGPRWQRRSGASRAMTLVAPPRDGAIGPWLSQRWHTIARQQRWSGRRWALTAQARTVAYAAEATAQRLRPGPS